MPILPLTARTVASLRAPSDRPRIEYFDAEVPGLTLRITSDGVKTWSLLYTGGGFDMINARPRREPSMSLVSGLSARPKRPGTGICSSDWTPATPAGRNDARRVREAGRDRDDVAIPPLASSLRPGRGKSRDLHEGFCGRQGSSR